MEQQDQEFQANNITGSHNDNNNNNILADGFSEGVLPNNPTNNSENNQRINHRHTPHQIQELENPFKNCAYPNEQQRLDMGRRIGLDSTQVKFWFQNRRTQLKSQMERQDYMVLKNEFDKLKVEQIAMKDAMKNPMCQNCGGPTMLGDSSMELTNLKFENDRLKDELSWVCGIADRMLGKHISNLFGLISIPNLSSSLELFKDRERLNGPMSSPTTLPMGVKFDHGASSNSTMIDCGVSTELEKKMYIQVAMAAMNELITMAQNDSPIWFKGLRSGKDMFNLEEYVKKFSNGIIGEKPMGFITDASRETNKVYITSLELMETMMNPRQFQELFPCMIGNATIIEILCNGTGGTRDGELQLMNIEFVIPSPLVSFLNGKILRFCKKYFEGMWAMVDVSIDMIREPSFSGSSVKWRILPSGCIIRDISNGYSLVTWIEHLEYDENYVHQLYQPLMRSGMAFGALRWLATLKRERDCFLIFMSNRIYPTIATVGVVTQEGRKSIFKLMRRISNNFCSSICASSKCYWLKMKVKDLVANVCVTRHMSINEPGKPSGVVLSASTSVWIPAPRQQLFEFLCNEKMRGKWDILANGGPMEVIARFPKSCDGINCVSLLCPPVATTQERNMLILQDSWSDQVASFIICAPVDSSSMDIILKGGDSDYLALLPSGFIVCDAPTLNNGNTNNESASALTIGFQILVNNLSANELRPESVNAVKDLISCTIKMITESLGIY